MEFDHFARDVIVEMLAPLPNDRMSLEKAILCIENKVYANLKHALITNITHGSVSAGINQIAEEDQSRWEPTSWIWTLQDLGL